MPLAIKGSCLFASHKEEKREEKKLSKILLTDFNNLLSSNCIYVM